MACDFRIGRDLEPGLAGEQQALGPHGQLGVDLEQAQHVGDHWPGESLLERREIAPDVGRGNRAGVDLLEQIEVAVHGRAQPPPRARLAELIDHDEDRRDEQDHAGGGEERRKGEAIEQRVNDNRESQPGSEPHETPRSLTLRQVLTDHGGHGGGAAVHHGGAQAAGQPQQRAHIVQARGVVEILDQGEPGADREAVDRGVHQEPDQATADQQRDPRELQRLLHDRRDPSEETGRHAQSVARQRVRAPGDDPGERAPCDGAQRLTAGDQLVAVHRDHPRQQQHDREEAREQREDHHPGSFRDTIQPLERGPRRQ